MNKDHKAQISSPTAHGKSVTSVGMPENKKKWHAIFFLLHVAVWGTVCLKTDSANVTCYQESK
jgi:hypothetical protein